MQRSLIKKRKPQERLWELQKVAHVVIFVQNIYYIGRYTK